MKNRTVYLLFILSAIFAYPCSAQQTRLLTADKHNEYGLVYSLPITVLDIEVSAQRTVFKPGPYSLYAKKYLGIDDAVLKAGENWEIESVRVTQRGVADSEEKYLMQLKPGAATFIQVAEDGMLLALNKEVEPGQAPEDLKGSELTLSTLDKDEYLQYVDENFMAAQSRAKRAQLLWETLMEVRNARLALAKGTAETMPADGRQLELMLQSLTKQEQALTDAFAGTIQTQTVVRKYSFIADDESETRNIICRFSQTDGFDTGGEPLYLTLERVDSPQLPKDDKGEVKKLPKDAVMYVLPGTAQVVLKQGKKELYNKELQFAQYGVNFGLNPILFTDRKAPSFATFNPVTGALETLGELK